MQNQRRKAPPQPPQVMPTPTQPEAAPLRQPDCGTLPWQGGRDVDRRAWHAGKLRLLWKSRRALARTAAAGFLISTLVAFLIPASYTSSTQLMPPDGQPSSGVAMMTALAKAGGGMGPAAGDLLGLKSNGALFVGMLRSESSQAKLVQQFDLKSVYGVKLAEDARTRLDERTLIAEDRKSGIIVIRVTDRSPQRAAGLAKAYVDQLNSLVTELSTSSAHRERVFLEDRLKVAKQDLDEAASDFAQFSSKNSTLDIQQMGKAMLDAAGNIGGQLIAAESELQGLRQIYTDDNARVQSLSARVAELRRQLARLDGGPRQTTDHNPPNMPGPNRLGTNMPGPNRSGTNPPGANQPGANQDGPKMQDASLVSAGSTDLSYPSIRSLPLLGVKYGDYYRRSKIQETVYELLTEQYELAKIQEAKETPSVKVLDAARVPEKKTFPPRTLLIGLGTFLACGLGVVWTAGLSRWRAADPEDPRRILFEEAMAALKTRRLWGTRPGAHAGNGSRPAS